LPLFQEFDILFGNCSDSVVYFVFQLNFSQILKIIWRSNLLTMTVSDEEY